MKNSLSKLSEKTQKIIRMRFWDDLKLKEIAEYFGTSPKNIYKTIKKGFGFSQASRHPLMMATCRIFPV